MPFHQLEIAWYFNIFYFLSFLFYLCETNQNVRTTFSLTFETCIYLGRIYEQDDLVTVRYRHFLKQKYKNIPIWGSLLLFFKRYVCLWWEIHSKIICTSYFILFISFYYYCGCFTCFGPFVSNAFYQSFIRSLVFFKIIQVIVLLFPPLLCTLVIDSSHICLELSFVYYSM